MRPRSLRSGPGRGLRAESASRFQPAGPHGPSEVLDPAAFAWTDANWPGLTRAYGLQFARAPRTMDLSLTYQALAHGDVDVIAGDATSGLMDALDLVALVDDRRYFPPYEAWSATLQRDPRILPALTALAGRLSVAAMRRMNDAVDRQKQPLEAVVSAWLRSH